MGHALYHADAVQAERLFSESALLRVQKVSGCEKSFRSVLSGDHGMRDDVNHVNKKN